MVGIVGIHLTSCTTIFGTELTFEIFVGHFYYNTWFKHILWSSHCFYVFPGNLIYLFQFNKDVMSCDLIAATWL